MATVKDVYDYIDSIAPFSTQEDFDNAGILVGHIGAQVKRVLVSLDITPGVVQEAVQLGAQLIVAHHPVIFTPMRAVTDDNVTGSIVLSLAEHKIAAICAHTNLDAAQGGVNDCLAEVLGLTQRALLVHSGVDGQGRPYGIGRLGILPETQSATQFAAYVKARLGASGVHLEDAGRPVHKVAVGGGACGSMLEDVARAGCDTFVTADVKYNVALDANALGINLLDAGHFPTENVVCAPLAQALQQAFPDVTVVKSEVHQEIFSTI